MEPVVGITCEVQIPKKDPAAWELLLDHSYADMVSLADGCPILIPVAQSKQLVQSYLNRVDGLIFVGGEDLDPELYGEERKRGTSQIFAPRLRFERWLFEGAYRRGMPMMGICFGMQLINVLAGGSLYQDIRRDAGSTMRHRNRKSPLHRVRFCDEASLGRIFGRSRMTVFGDHHQAVRRLAPGFRASAIAPDGIVEAIENEAGTVFGLQFHPEVWPKSRNTRRLMRHFVELCRRYHQR